MSKVLTRTSLTDADRQQVERNIRSAGVRKLDDLVDIYVLRPLSLGKCPDKKFLKRLKEIRRIYFDQEVLD